MKRIYADDVIIKETNANQLYWKMGAFANSGDTAKLESSGGDIYNNESTKQRNKRNKKPTAKIGGMLLNDSGNVPFRATPVGNSPDGANFTRDSKNKSAPGAAYRGCGVFRKSRIPRSLAKSPQLYTFYIGIPNMY